MKHRANIAIGFEVSLRHALHHRIRRIIGDEVACDLKREVLCRARIAR